MAVSLAELVVNIFGDTKKLEESFDDAEKKTESAGNSIAKTLGTAIASGAALAGTAILAIGGKAFDVASQIDAATDQIGASLGLGADEAKAYGDAIKAVYGDNFGSSIEDVGKSVEIVAKQLKLAGNDPSLKKITENAYRLQDVFGTDVADSIDAVRTLMDNFGVTADEAFDHLTAGYQAGLDRSGDFLDTIGEYSVQFAEGGASMTEFFSALDTGLQGGVLGTDKAADAFKEFRVRIQDGSTLTAQSLEMIGLNAEDITTKLADGSITVKDAWDLVQRALQQTTDTGVQMQAGVGLIGTQFEDLGAKAVLAMDLTNDWAEGGLKSTSELDSKYTNLGSVFEGMWRQFQVGIAPAGEALLGLANENLPAIQGAINTATGLIVSAVGLIPIAIATARTAWDEDWAGIRSTWESFASEMPKKQEEFWREWNTAFGHGSQENEKSWEEFFANIFGRVNKWGTFVQDLLILIFKNWNNTTDAWQALTQGDWSTFWTNIGENFQNAFNVLLGFLDIFNMQFKEKMVQGLQDAWDGLKSLWTDVSDWWNTNVGGLLGFKAPTGIDTGGGGGGGGGFGNFPNLDMPSLIPPGGLQPQAQAQALGNVVVNQTFYGQVDTFGVKTASEDGVMRAGRNMGLR